MIQLTDLFFDFKLEGYFKWLKYTCKHLKFKFYDFDNNQMQTLLA